MMLASIDAADAGQPRKANAMLDATPNASPTRILFAEDSQHLREYMTKQLRARGYVVTDVPSGDEALAALLGGVAADLLVTDINMPGSLDGWALARRCREIHPQLSVIYASSERAVPEEQVADSHFVPKPYQFPVLLIAIQQVEVERRDGDGLPVATDMAPSSQVPVFSSSA
jgi:CheY-like chemotaxis protein